MAIDATGRIAAVDIPAVEQAYTDFVVILKAYGIHAGGRLVVGGDNPRTSP